MINRNIILSLSLYIFILFFFYSIIICQKVCLRMLKIIRSNRREYTHWPKIKPHQKVEFLKGHHIGFLLYTTQKWASYRFLKFFTMAHFIIFTLIWKAFIMMYFTAAPLSRNKILWMCHSLILFFFRKVNFSMQCCCLFLG